MQTRPTRPHGIAPAAAILTAACAVDVTAQQGEC